MAYRSGIEAPSFWDYLANGLQAGHEAFQQRKELQRQEADKERQRLLEAFKMRVQLAQDGLTDKADNPETAAMSQRLGFGGLQFAPEGTQAQQINDLRRQASQPAQITSAPNATGAGPVWSQLAGAQVQPSGLDQMPDMQRKMIGMPTKDEEAQTAFNAQVREGKKSALGGGVVTPGAASVLGIKSTEDLSADHAKNVSALVQQPAEAFVTQHFQNALGSISPGQGMLDILHKIDPTALSQQAFAAAMRANPTFSTMRPEDQALALATFSQKSSELYHEFTKAAQDELHKKAQEGLDWARLHAVGDKPEKPPAMGMQQDLNTKINEIGRLRWLEDERDALEKEYNKMGGKGHLELTGPVDKLSSSLKLRFGGRNDDPKTAAFLNRVQQWAQAYDLTRVKFVRGEFGKSFTKIENRALESTFPDRSKSDQAIINTIRGLRLDFERELGSSINALTTNYPQYTVPHWKFLQNPHAYGLPDMRQLKSESGDAERAKELFPDPVRP